MAAVLEHHLTNTEIEDKECALKLLIYLYVDNCVTSVNTMDEYEKFKKKNL
jgi:hypothetical protein